MSVKTKHVGGCHTGTGKRDDGCPFHRPATEDMAGYCRLSGRDVGDTTVWDGRELHPTPAPGNCPLRRSDFYVRLADDAPAADAFPYLGSKEGR